MASQRIQDLPASERPREKMENRGAKSLSDAELLALFFRTGTPGVSAIAMSNALIERFGNLQAVSRATSSELQEIPGIGPAKASELLGVFEMGRRLAKAKVTTRPIDQPELVYELLGPEMQTLHRESLRVILLNTRNHLIRVEEVSLGTANESLAHPREVLRPALIHSASSFILVHNHPSGDPDPSQADRRLTSRIREAAKIIDVKFVDHIIIGYSSDEHEPYFSFREMGLL